MSVTVRTTSLLGLALLLGACASPGPRPPDSAGSGAASGSAGRGGGYYLDDGPGRGAPVNLAAIPDAVPRVEPLRAVNSRPYEVFGRRYVPMTELTPYRSRGVASWYGRRYHGRQTSSGEIYDMYAMTAAHPTLPLPSYVRVTHLGNGRSVVLRVNDRGPFLNDRLIDLSWTAAAKLGYVEAGSAEVEVELITDPVAFVAAQRGDGGAPGQTAQPSSRSGTAIAAATISSSAAAEGGLRSGGVASTVLAGGAGAAPAGSDDAPPVLSMRPATAANADAPALRVEPAVPAQESAPLRLEVLTVPAEAAAPVSAPAPAAPASAVQAPAAARASAAGASAAGASAAGASAAGASAAGASASAPAGTQSPMFLQFAALSSQQSAQALRTRLAAELGWLADRVEVRADGGLFKVQAGPWPGRDAALAAAERVRQANGMQPIPVAR